MSATEYLERWHQVVRSGDLQGLQALLAEDVVFHSPVVHAPQRGRKKTFLYLTAAFRLLGNDTFRYVREVTQGDCTIVEFQVEVEGISVNGVDIITWNAAGQIVEFKVMIRPLQAIQLVHQKMARLLEAAGRTQEGEDG